MKHRLIIEVDGGQHNFDQNRLLDSFRDEKLPAAVFGFFDFGTMTSMATFQEYCSRSVML
jgi:very-short-patch-repair endonuclease